MTSMTFFLIFIPILAILLLIVNLIFAPHNSYQEKDSPFECGFHSFIAQNRTQFNISFFIFALLFLLFDLEILLVYPYVVSAYANGIYGLMLMLIFFLALTLGFAFELGKGALKLTSRQNNIDIKPIKSISTININYSLDSLEGVHTEKAKDYHYDNNSAINKLKSRIWQLIPFFIADYISLDYNNIDVNNINFYNINSFAYLNETIIAILVILLLSIAIIIILLMDDSTAGPSTVKIKKEEEDEKPNFSVPKKEPNGSDEESEKQQVLRKILLQKVENFVPRHNRNIYSWEYLDPTVLSPSNITWLHGSLAATHPGKYEIKFGYRDRCSGRQGIIITHIGSAQAIKSGINLLADITACP